MAVLLVCPFSPLLTTAGSAILSETEEQDQDIKHRIDNHVAIVLQRELSYLVLCFLQRDKNWICTLSALNTVDVVFKVFLI